MVPIIRDVAAFEWKWKKWLELQKLNVEKVILTRHSMGSGTHNAYLSLDSIIAEAQVLQVGSCVGLHWGEVVLEHVNHLR